MDGLLLRCDRFTKVAQALEPTLQGIVKVIKTSWLVGVTTRVETNDLLLSCDRFIEIDKIA
jgi:hypothetical protein